MTWTRNAGVLVTTLTSAAALLLLCFGLWAMVAPDSFFGTIASYPPYSRHLIHDLGAFQLGLGACLLLGLVLRDALLAVLAGNAVGAAAHFVSHMADRSLGGRPSDPLSVGVLAAVLVLLVAVRFRESPR